MRHSDGRHAVNRRQQHPGQLARAAAEPADTEVNVEAADAADNDVGPELPPKLYLTQAVNADQKVREII